MCIYIGITGRGIPGWHSGLVPAFGPGRDPGDPGSNPTSGSRCMEPASPSACVSASLFLSCVLSNVSQFQVQKLWSPYPISVWDSSVICDLVSRSPAVFSHRVALPWVSFAVKANLCSDSPTDRGWNGNEASQRSAVDQGRAGTLTALACRSPSMSHFYCGILSGPLEVYPLGS